MSTPSEFQALREAAMTTRSRIGERCSIARVVGTVGPGRGENLAATMECIWWGQEVSR